MTSFFVYFPRLFDSPNTIWMSKDQIISQVLQSRLVIWLLQMLLRERILTHPCPIFTITNPIWNLTIRTCIKNTLNMTVRRQDNEKYYLDKVDSIDVDVVVKGKDTLMSVKTF